MQKNNGRSLITNDDDIVEYIEYKYVHNRLVSITKSVGFLLPKFRRKEVVLWRKRRHMKWKAWMS